MSKQTEIEIQTADGSMPAFQSSPDSSESSYPKGAIVVIQEAFGVTEHIKSIVTRLSDAGWLAVAPAIYHRSGSPVLDYGDMEKVMPLFQELNAKGLKEDLSCTFDFLESQDFETSKIGIVGFCMGGTLSFYAATLRPIGAAVTFYGGGVKEGRFGLPSLIELSPSLKSPWLGLYGDLDQGIAISEVEELRDATRNGQFEAEVVRYSEAGHGFNCNDRPQAFNQDAANDAWQRTLNWFDRHLTS